jgi:hypothetical protein
MKTVEIEPSDGTNMSYIDKKAPASAVAATNNKFVFEEEDDDSWTVRPNSKFEFEGEEEEEEDGDDVDWGALNVKRFVVFVL